MKKEEEAKTENRIKKFECLIFLFHFLNFRPHYVNKKFQQQQKS